MKKIVFFSNNRNKIEEVLRLFKQSNIHILSLSDFPKIKEPKENGTTFEENAKIKSTYGFINFKLPCFADDSGICISALGNLPGIQSKKFIERNGGLEKTFSLIIDRVKKLDDNRAYFNTTISLTANNNKTVFFNGLVRGKISRCPRGDYGFHYDPIFVPEGNNKTYAEMTLDEKTRISHRSIAIEKLIKYLLKSSN